MSLLWEGVGRIGEGVSGHFGINRNHEGDRRDGVVPFGVSDGRFIDRGTRCAAPEGAGVGTRPIPAHGSRRAGSNGDGAQMEGLFCETVRRDFPSGVGGLTESLVKFGIARRAGSDGRGAYPRRCGRVRRATWSEVRLNRTRSAAGISREPCEPRFPRSPARRSEKMRSADEHESGLGRSTTRAGPLARRRQRARRTHLAHPRRRVDLPRRRTLPPRGAEAPASVGARR